METEDFKYIRNTYGVPAEMGRRVVVDGCPGIIAKDCGQYIGVNFDKNNPGEITNCHPTWEVKYGDIGVVRKAKKQKSKTEK